MDLHTVGRTRRAGEDLCDFSISGRVRRGTSPVIVLALTTSSSVRMVHLWQAPGRTRGCSCGCWTIPETYLSRCRTTPALYGTSRSRPTPTTSLLHVVNPKYACGRLTRPCLQTRYARS